MIAEKSQSQRERLAFIEFRSYFLGEIKRNDLSERFGIAAAAATRDLAMYRSISNGNIYLDQKLKAYLPSKDFVPVFNYSAERVFMALSQGLGDDRDVGTKALITSEMPKPLHWPDIKVLAPITRAIHRKRVVKITYSSFSSGKVDREIIPFALIDNGLRWHVRAYDRYRNEFLDFVLTRVTSSEELDGYKIEEHELATNDIQWNRIVNLEIVPHPKEKYPEIIAMDYGIQNGVLNVKVRASLAGYFLQQWSVDCSVDHHLSGTEIRLWLKNPLTLYAVSSARLAPGYQHPT